MTMDQFHSLLAEVEARIINTEHGDTPEADRLIVQSGERYYAFEVGALPGLRRDEVKELLRGEREVVELYTMTRIVGYYSQVANWNKSKIGELESRRRGVYDVEPQAAVVREAAD